MSEDQQQKSNVQNDCRETANDGPSESREKLIEQERLRLRRRGLTEQEVNLHIAQMELLGEF